MSGAAVKITSKNGEIVCSEVNAADFMSFYLDFYVQHPVEAVPPECFPNIKKLISFAAAYLPFMPQGWSFAWNVSMPGQKRKLFCSVDSENGTFVAKSHSWEPADYENAPHLTVQMVSDVTGMDSVTLVDCDPSVPSDQILDELFKRFFDDQSQNSLRVYEKDEFFGIKNTPEELEYEQEEETREESLIFRCGCTKSRIAALFKRMPAKDIDYLFEQDEVLSVECPRCGLKYEIKKHDIK